MQAGRLRYLLGAAFYQLAWTEWGPADGAPGDIPVVCVHGLTRNGRDFDALAQALAAQGRRVLCPDLPGRGLSDWLPDPAMYAPPVYVGALAHLLARLDGPVDWVGTSLGGICGMMVAAATGHPIRRLVLNDVGPLVPQAAIARIQAYLAETPRFADLAAVEAHLRQVHAPFGQLTDAQWGHLAHHSARAAPEGGLMLHFDPALAVPIRARPPEPVDLSALWELVSVPVLAIRGAESDLLLPETLAAMAARPGVRVAEIPAVGHAPALMDASQVALVAGFLD
ncbi:alpha/beta fold hydrolase [Falsiroseomonas sp.]|uniref:alpha/beta fold hydrolase n=1 Tax=Falsiroseomonas sp. TaxID=2870721 RepID=UPI0027197F7A|nr:alpha/beta hydrolase [Falsiroseomonas sp.]MDO9502621.1 alpha/beta hydrolase [Falsiroseomonas sp.]